jgi:hypothetical protein
MASRQNDKSTLWQGGKMTTRQKWPKQTNWQAENCQAGQMSGG